jgi:hypothetical protein
MARFARHTRVISTALRTAGTANATGAITAGASYRVFAEKPDLQWALKPIIPVHLWRFYFHRLLSVRRQSFWDRRWLKIRESLAPLVCNIMRLADGAASGDWRWSVV